MPIFEFECRGCDERFEIFVRGETALVCPSCEGTDLKKLISLPRIKGEKTRAKAMKAAKARDASQASENHRERHEYEHNHDH